MNNSKCSNNMESDPHAQKHKIPREFPCTFNEVATKCLFTSNSSRLAFFLKKGNCFLFSIFTTLTFRCANKTARGLWFRIKLSTDRASLVHRSSTWKISAALLSFVVHLFKQARAVLKTGISTSGVTCLFSTFCPNFENANTPIGPCRKEFICAPWLKAVIASVLAKKLLPNIAETSRGFTSSNVKRKCVIAISAEISKNKRYIKKVSFCAMKFVQFSFSRTENTLFI